MHLTPAELAALDREMTRVTAASRAALCEASMRGTLAPAQRDAGAREAARLGVVDDAETFDRLTAAAERLAGLRPQETP